MVRKPDPEMRGIIRSSEALKSVENLYACSIHPSLIMFDKDLAEHLVQFAIKRLHGNHLLNSKNEGENEQYNKH